MDAEISDITKALDKELTDVKDLKQLELLELHYLGRKGKINSLLTSLSHINKGDIKSVGLQINTFKKTIQGKIASRRKLLTAELTQSESIDVTIPGTLYPHGSLHIVTYAIEEISRIFERLGFIRMSYPEIEWEYFSFESLNMPKDHPARDDFETFFIDTPPHQKYGKMVLTPHTSSGQIREMLRLKKPPIKMINIAKTYRPNWDATHVPMFHQFEGFCVDTDINITHLKGTIEYFARTFFGPDCKIRLRPFHFQFTEPSFEVDITCDVCKGKGQIGGTKCKVCKSGWLEIGGSGMVHPNILREGGIDPKKYQGWAFGFGVERVYMMKKGLNLDDLRILYTGDIRFLEQF